MQGLELVDIFTAPLEANKIPYFVTGSMASIIYGEPRLTHDVDLVLNIKESHVELFEKIFPLEKFYCPPPESILLEVKREARAHFNLIHHKTGFKADCYIAGNSELHRWAFDHKRTLALGEGHLINVAPPEYVIIRKLEFYREGESQKHIRDIKGMIAISTDTINEKILEDFVQKFGLQKEWELVKLPT